LVIHFRMFDIGWSELLIIAVMALIVVGPKDLPVLLRTVGRYVGIVRRQAAEFRAQFDEALRESELDQIRKDVAGLKQDVASTMHEAARGVERDLDARAADASARQTLEDKTDLKPESGKATREADSQEEVGPVKEAGPAQSVASQPHLETSTEGSGRHTDGSAEKSGV
jgi:sec-independent protein translocase protein TatB